MTKQKLGQQLKTLRIKRGVSNRELRRQGVHANLINQIERGESNYTIDSLLDYCEKLDITLTVESYPPP